jgi:ubiquinone/menaquinone biosynthesis C-methylase UbiE
VESTLKQPEQQTMISMNISINWDMTESRIKKRYNRIAAIYDLIEKPMERAFSGWRKEMLRHACGKVLEVGIGTGKNIVHYPRGIHLIGIDFSEKMISEARKKYGNQSWIEFILMDAEEMDFRNNTFDTVVTSCVFCSVPDPIKGLKEIRRVCKKGGTILMLEHVKSSRKITGKLMDIINPLPLWLYGANINRDTEKNLLRAGFKQEHIKIINLWSDIVKKFIIENIK